MYKERPFWSFPISLLGGVAVKIIWKVLDNLEEYMASTLLIITSFIVFIQVFLRFVFSYSMHWSSEAAIYLIIWFIFIGSSIAIREKAHVTVDAIVVLLPKCIQKVFAVIAYSLSVIFCIILVKVGLDMVNLAINKGITTPAMEIPMFLPYLAVPVGFLLMLIRFSQELLKEIKSLIINDASAKGGS